MRLPRQTVLRGGYGMNYTTNSYANFAGVMALQPPFANLQTNVAASSCPTTGSGCLSIADGFPAPNLLGSYAVDPHYRLPYVQVWNVDIQKTLPWGIVMNAGYNGSKGSNLDVTIAPRATEASPLTNPGNVLFNYEQAEAFSRFNAGTLRVNKRLSSGIALGANYQYSHSIDDAGSVGGTSTSSPRTGRTSWPRKGTPASMFGTRFRATISTNSPLAKISSGSHPESHRTFSKAFLSPAPLPLPAARLSLPVIRPPLTMSPAALPAPNVPIVFPAFLSPPAAAH